MRRATKSQAADWGLFLLLTAVAAGITLPVGEFGLGRVKLVGAAAAAAAFAPAFILLRSAMGRGFNRTLAVFVGGFFFKLTVVTAAVWFAVKKAGWPAADFAVSCTAFLMSAQIFEAVYFYRRQTAVSKAFKDTEQ